MKKILLPIMILSMNFNCFASEIEPFEEKENCPIIIDIEAAESNVHPDGTMISTLTKYAKYPTGIYVSPDKTSSVYDYSLKNTSFTVVEENENWTTVQTCNGVAYVETKDLSDSPVEEREYTEDELYIMAHLLAGEAQFCSDEEQRYVGSVALNRVKHESFPDNLEDVVFQKGQYACTWDGNYDREPTKSNWENAKWILENGSILPDKVIYQSGCKQGKVYVKTKYHYYCY